MLSDAEAEDGNDGEFVVTVNSEGEGLDLHIYFFGGEGGGKSIWRSSL